MRVALSAFVILCLSVTAPAGEPPDTNIIQLHWLAGHWVDSSEGNLSEETWVAPSGDCMVGMWRLVVNGKARVYELLTITQEEDSVVMRLRHFDRAGVGWEDKEHPLLLRLTEMGTNMALFQGPGTEGFLRLTYRASDSETLTVILEKGPSEKEAKREEFRFVRRPL